MKNVLNFFIIHRKSLILIAILGVTLLLRLAFLHEPFERDEGHYAAIAQEILRGGIPYRDAVEIKPPGAFYIYALAIWIFGATTEGIRIFTSLYALLTVISVYAFARRISDFRAGFFAAATYGIFSTMPLLQGSSSNTEVFLVLPMTAGALFFVSALESKKRIYFGLSGACAAFSLLIKTVALPVVILEFLFIVVLLFKNKVCKKSLIDSLAFLIPMLSIAFLTCAYFLLSGAFEDFFYWNAVFPIRYRDSGISGPPLQIVLQHLKPSLLFPATLAVLSLPWFWIHKRTQAGIFTLMLLPTVWCAIALPGKYFPHYFINAIPILSILSGIALAHFTRVRIAISIPTMGISLAILYYSAAQNYRFYYDFTPEAVSTIKYGPIFANVVPVASYLKERTHPDDYIFQWGLEPEIYFLANRRSPTPHVASLTLGWSKDPMKAQKELLEALLTKRPKYIVFQDEWSNLPGLSEVLFVIENYYVLDQQLPFGFIARRNDLPYY
jgi:4-amino-4-deoxy-L-arabinose transferase-like glycosyltransferase